MSKIDEYIAMTREAESGTVAEKVERTLRIMLDRAASATFSPSKEWAACFSEMKALWLELCPPGAQEEEFGALED